MASRKKINLQDFEITTTIGWGSCCRVLLCQSRLSGQYFAMKRMKKVKLIESNLVDHIFNENDIVESINHPQIVSSRVFAQLIKTESQSLDHGIANHFVIVFSPEIANLEFVYFYR